MSRRTRPKQYLDANNNVIPYQNNDGGLRVFYEGGNNARYYCTARSNKTQESNADYETKTEWKIFRLTYLGNNATSKHFVDGDDDWIAEVDNGAQRSISAVTQGDPGVVTLSATTWSDGTDVADGDKIEITDATGMTELNGNTYFVSGWASGPMTFNLHRGNNLNADASTNEDTTAFGAYTGSGIANKRSYLNHNYF